MECLQITQTAILDVNIPVGAIATLEDFQIADAQKKNYVVRTPEGYIFRKIKAAREL